MQLTFAFNSDRLSPEARLTLDNLGKALQSEELKADAFRIEGHTDSKGSRTYNQHLSERRAQSVARYLVERFGIEPTRLQTVGKGEDMPLNPNDPENPKNRRVQIVNLGS
jgi:outer membrane protein OmpA-like peptidoglycan-associated protein